MIKCIFEYSIYKERKYIPSKSKVYTFLKGCNQCFLITLIL